MDFGCKAQRLLQTLSMQAKADCALIFFVRGMRLTIGPAFVGDCARSDAIQAALTAAQDAWLDSGMRSKLESGDRLTLEQEGLWPLLPAGHVVALLYLSSVPADFGEPKQQATVERIAYHARRLADTHPWCYLVEAARALAPVWRVWAEATRWATELPMRTRRRALVLFGARHPTLT